MADLPSSCLSLIGAIPAPPHVLLVGWDAADWQVIHPLLDAGRMPHLQRLVDRGIIGNLHSLQPMLSPILWTSIATGKRAYGHGVRGFVEPTPDRAGVRPVGTRSRRCKALWNIASQSGLRSVVCGWMASHPAEPVRGAVVSNVFAVPPPGTRPDAWLPAAQAVQPPELADALVELRLHPAEVEAAMLQALIPRAAELDQRDPSVRRRLAALAKSLAEVIGVHAVATELLETQPWDFGAVYYECIDQVGHEFMPFHPPHQDGIPAAEYAVYHEVMVRLYQFHDEMLGRLLELAGPAAHVVLVSDHGFESGTRRPHGPVEPAQWHRRQGVLAMSGPGIRTDARIEGATLLDVAPTVLALLGLPAGDDMEGRVLVNAFDETLAARMPTRIASWEAVPGNDGRLDPLTGEEDPATAQALLAQFAALGYIEPPDENARRAVIRAEAEADFNLASSLQEGGRALEAKKLFAKLTERHPEEGRYWHALAGACFAAGTPTEAAASLATLERMQPGQTPTLVLRGLLAWARGNLESSAEAFAEAARLAPDEAASQTYLGRLYLRQRRWADAEQAFVRALALDPDSAEAHYGLSVALPRQGRSRVEPGVEYALRAVGLKHEFPEAHFQLGALLSRLGWFERAAQAFEMSLRLQPGFLHAHRYLERIYRRLERTTAAARHRAILEQLATARTAQPDVD